MITSRQIPNSVLWQALLERMRSAADLGSGIEGIYILNLHTGTYRIDDPDEQGNMTAINHLLRRWVDDVSIAAATEVQDVANSSTTAVAKDTVISTAAATEGKGESSTASSGGGGLQERQPAAPERSGNETIGSIPDHWMPLLPPHSISAQWQRRGKISVVDWDLLSRARPFGPPMMDDIHPACEILTNDDGPCVRTNKQVSTFLEDTVLVFFPMNSSTPMFTTDLSLSQISLGIGWMHGCDEHCRASGHLE